MNQKHAIGHVGWSPDYKSATPKMSVCIGQSLNDELDYAAEHLPEGWSIRIDVERGVGSVTAIRPDGTEVDMHDGESDLSEQFRTAIRLAYDEIDTHKLSDTNDQCPPTHNEIT